MSTALVLGGKPTRIVPRTVTLTPSQIVSSLAQWREQYNPVAGLTMSRARELIESYPRGDFADLMWTFGAPFTGIENADADLLALIELRSSAVQELDWEITKKDAKTRDFDQTLADEQESALREAYDDIDNLQEAIEHLCLSSFRGFSHCEKYRKPDRSIYHLEVLDQWNVVRDGTRGAWRWNPLAQPLTFRSLPEQFTLNMTNFVFREAKRPIGRIALVKWIRENLSQKDWDAFIEIYGIPGGVVTMPPNVPVDRERDYESAARGIAKGGSGALPSGSTYTPNDSPRGTNPFRDHLQYLSEKLVLAGTGGKLTMLAESGTGTLGGGAHMETFERIGRKEARAISETFQKSIDAEIMRVLFPGRPALAYFALGQNEETDPVQFVAQVASLATAGYDVDLEQIKEKTGLRVTKRPVNAPQPFGAPAPVLV
jgi:phage gp29-like protein